MLYRLHVNSLLRERQVVALIDRFDVDRKGKQVARRGTLFRKGNIPKQNRTTHAYVHRGRVGVGARGFE